MILMLSNFMQGGSIVRTLYISTPDGMIEDSRHNSISTLFTKLYDSEVFR